MRDRIAQFKRAFASAVLGYDETPYSAPKVRDRTAQFKRAFASAVLGYDETPCSPRESAAIGGRFAGFWSSKGIPVVKVVTRFLAIKLADHYKLVLQLYFQLKELAVIR